MRMKIITGYTGTQHIQSADDAAFNSGVVSQGNVVLNTGNGLSAQILSGNIVRIGSGDIVCNGRHARIENYEDVKIANGSQGINRTDAIVARYAKNESTGIESITLQVIKGGNGAAAIPLDGDMLLYYVTLKGVNIVGVTPQFNVLASLNELTAHINEEVSAIDKALNNRFSSLSKRINDHAGNTLNPHMVTKGEIGLDKVDNYSMRQMYDLIYPIGITVLINANPNSVGIPGVWQYQGANAEWLVGTGNYTSQKAWKRIG